MQTHRIWRHVIWLGVLVLVGCGETQPPATNHGAGMHGGEGTQNAETSRTGDAKGTIRGVDLERRTLMIEHGPIDGIGMGAMTMQFGAVDAVDLGGISVDDTVAFTVKAGRDGRYRVTALCAIDAESTADATGCP